MGSVYIGAARFDNNASSSTFIGHNWLTITYILLQITNFAKQSLIEKYQIPCTIQDCYTCLISLTSYYSFRHVCACVRACGVVRACDARVQTGVRACVRTYVRACVCVRTCVHAYVCSRVLACVLACVRGCVRACECVRQLNGTVIAFRNLENKTSCFVLNLSKMDNQISRAVSRRELLYISLLLLLHLFTLFVG